MAKILEIAEVGEKVLFEKAKSLTKEELKNPSIQELIDDMVVTVKDKKGVGLAAPQVFQSVRIIIVDSHPNPRYPYAPDFGPTAMINPEITYQSQEKEKDWEGCLSIPGIRALIPRSKKITLRYLTRDGVEKTEDLEGFLARVIQHETDHLDGIICILDRVEKTQDIVSEKNFKKMIAQRN